MKSKLYCFTILFLLHFLSNAQTIRFVKPTASGTGNGSSWANASADLQGIINISGINDQVWVAAGTYKPALNNSFSMQKDVSILGGFPDTGSPGIADRNWSANPTILQGNGTRVVNNNNNGLTNSAVLDGFTVTGGNVSGDNGGGVNNDRASPTFINCIFSGNRAWIGGGMSIVGCSPILTNCVFIGNVADTNGGGLLVSFNGSTAPIVTNCTFSGNQASNSGGGVFNTGGTGQYNNCIIWGNTNGFLGSSSFLPTINNSLIEGHGIGNGIISNSNPLFISQPSIGLGTSGNLRLQACSPVLNIGNASFNNTSVDLAKNPRIYNSGSIDLGAYEYQGAAVTPPTRLYVNATATGANNGLTWADSFTDLQSALNYSCKTNLAEIWVAAGTYKPSADPSGNTSPSDPRTKAFVMKNGVAIYGGFSGTETLFSERNLATNKTILSGEIGAAGTSDNAYRIINNTFTTANPLLSTAVLDGFTLEAAKANGPFPLNLGGAIWNTDASPTIRNCTFRNNFADAGGGIFFDKSSSILSNCLFINNSCAGSGSAISCGGGTDDVKVLNSTFYGNTGGTTIENQASAKYTNCIVWGNSNGVNGGNFTNSIIQGGYGGAGNLNTNPLFVNAAGGDFSLQSCSPAINSGDNTGISGVDLANNPRIFGSTIDLGAYEYQGMKSGPSRLFVNATATGANNGLTWADAFTDLQSALNYYCKISLAEIWVAAGTYKPSADPSGNTSPSDPRTKAFVMLNGVAIYGGFSGTETQLSERNWTTNLTILSGEIGAAGTSDNTYRIINNTFNPNNRLLSTAILDGFTLEAAKANGPFPLNLGGAIWNTDASPTIRNCTFRNNFADAGGGIFFDKSSSILSNCLFINNSCAGSGSAISCGGGTDGVKVLNSTFYGNTGGTTIENEVSARYTNCIIWGNSNEVNGGNFTNSIIQGGYGGAGNLNNNPLFVNAAGGDFSLQACSPAINKGDNSGISGVDFANNPRIYNNGTVDMGAFEYQGTAISSPTAVSISATNICLGTSVNLSANCALGTVTWYNASTDGTTLGTGSPFNYNAPVGANQTFYASCKTVNCETALVATSNTLTYSAVSRLYVNASATGINNGETWADAFTDLQTALTNARSNICVTEIWVAKGTYKPHTSDRNISFSMVNNVAIYGGFPNTGNPTMADRNWNINQTILSGDILTIGVNTDNSHRIIYNSGLSSSAILDGVTICDAYNPNDFNGSQGAGVRNDNSSPTFRNCIIRNNYTGTNGGGVANENGSPSFYNCVFKENQCFSGGGMYSLIGSPMIINCTFNNNRAYNGGAITGNLSSTKYIITNCIIWDNIATNEDNSIHNNQNATPTVTYSIIQGGYDGTGNLNSNPLFNNASGGDFSLQQCSPAINAGNNTGISGMDLANNPRIYNSGIVDLGAYEYQGVAATPPARLYVNATATGANNGLTWADAFTDLQSALNYSCKTNLTEIWVAEGTYLPELNNSFTMLPNVAILGGFPNTGNPAISDRNWSDNPTILQGNGSRVINNYDNGLTTSAVLDGFTVTGGNANGFGGGANNYRVSPTFLNCIFSGNRASSGGGMIISGGSPILTNCVFIGNLGSVTGGGLEVVNSGTTTAPIVTNCTFSGNKAPNDNGGGVHNVGGTGQYNNCIIWGNTNGFLYQYSSSIPIINNSLIEGQSIGNGIISNSNPFFVSQPSIGLGTAGDLRLQACSPALNIGNATFNNTSVDLDLNPRAFGSAIDLGAYEYQNNFSYTLPIVNTTVNQSVTNTVFAETPCTILAKIEPIPGNPVAGDVEVKTWIESVPPFNLVPRHYQITPTVDPNTATAKVTLYFSQADFKAYNDNNNNIKLPINPTDTEGIGHIEILKYSGSSPNGLPAGYPSQTPKLIPNSDLTIIWEGNYWSISFETTGFSGFFVKTASQPLPINLISFTGKATENGNELIWKTSQEKNFSHFEIERTSNAKGFEKIGKVEGNNAEVYEFVDSKQTTNYNPQTYYRLKMIDLDGSSAYSKIIAIQNSEKENTVGQFYPNPTIGEAKVNVSANESGNWTIKTFDILGKLIGVQYQYLQKGSNVIEVKTLSKGMNYIQLFDGTKTEIRKILNQ